MEEIHPWLELQPEIAVLIQGIFLSLSPTPYFMQIKQLPDLAEPLPPDKC